jgi:hypothetical protein
MASASPTPTIGQLFQLPERVNPTDYVLKLSEGVSDPTATIQQYVVTPQLAVCFDKALTLIRGAVERRQSVATYLHGSFGAGKSHFMAMLYLLLNGNTQARSVPELAEVVQRMGTWAQGRRFLLIPYYLMDAESVEQCLLGGYVDHVRRLHPEQPPAGLYRSDSMIENARGLRQQFGEAAFFAALNRTTGPGAGWGQIASTWDGARFEAACEAGPAEPDRVQLVSDLAATVLTTARHTADFVSLGEGLSIMSRHAKSLGYDAVILFLDELILWLASRAASVDFVTREAPKLVNLVESSVAERPVPIVSFVARQRDLRTVLGEQAVGSEVKNFEDALNYFEARFDQIRLEDRNLPTIAEKRLLVPKDSASAELIRQSFESVKKIKDSVKEILLTQEGDLEQFRQVYPFSPALVKTLVGVSAALQRERTALKIMVQLLVDQRDTLHLGEIMPVGDLFGVMLEGHDAFSAEMKQRFDAARKLWEQKLRPLAEEDAATVGIEARDRRLKENERIIGTLALAALTPELDTLKTLTPRRLAALNHGSIKVSIPGTEANSVWKRLQDWSSKVGEIRIKGEGVDAVVTLQLSGVDTNTIISGAAHEDNPGNRLRTAKQLLFEEIGVDPEGGVYCEYSFKWKATARAAELRFSNVWETDDSKLQPSGDPWLVVIDFPFDRDGHTPQDDVERLAEFKARHARQGARTLVWLPSFFSLETQRAVGKLTILDFLLANDQRLKEYSANLSSVERAEARMLLENQRSSLRDKVKRALREAYGVQAAEPGMLDPAYELEPAQQFQCLEGSLPLRPPVAATLADALNGILAQALEHEFPAHPDFREDEVKITDTLVKRALEEIRNALAAPELRVLINKDTRKLLRPLLEPLELAHVGDQWLLVERTWMDHFDRCEAQHQGPVTVRDLRRWIDHPRPKGLPVSLQNLIINTYVLQSNRLLILQGIALDPGSTPLRDETLVEKQELPSQEMWAKAVDRAGKVFGVTGLPLASAQNMARLAQEVRKVASEYREPSDNYLAKLATVLRTCGVMESNPPRHQTALSVRAAMAALEAPQKPILVVRTLQTMATATSENAMGKSLKQASSMLGALQNLNLLMFEGLRQIADEPRATAARGLIEKLHEALCADEYVISLAAVLPNLQVRATELIVVRPPQPPPETVPPRPPVTPVPPIELPPIPPTPTPKHRKVVSQGSKTTKGMADCKAVLQEIESSLDEGSELRLSWEIVREETE